MPCSQGVVDTAPAVCRLPIAPCRPDRGVSGPVEISCDIKNRRLGAGCRGPRRTGPGCGSESASARYSAAPRGLEGPHVVDGAGALLLLEKLEELPAAVAGIAVAGMGGVDGHLRAVGLIAEELAGIRLAWLSWIRQPTPPQSGMSWVMDWIPCMNSCARPQVSLAAPGPTHMPMWLVPLRLQPPPQRGKSLSKWSAVCWAWLVVMLVPSVRQKAKWALSGRRGAPVSPPSRDARHWPLKH